MNGGNKMPKDKFSFMPLGSIDLTNIKFEETFRKRSIFPSRKDKFIKPRYDPTASIFKNDTILKKENKKIGDAIFAFQDSQGLSNNRIDKNGFSGELIAQLDNKKYQKINDRNDETLKLFIKEMRISNIQPVNRAKKP